ncbi:hypothetical protein KIMH_09180 [Bombiscardovia apis]|uniref:HTH merR-type domain-containing protein n=1 Tax=Bombiscardovia apis TaxID=2932182 RepID=A0ABM8BD38_9BIFI|nr:MerR family transcriptional regulator [Bombiscardovia apis]BDR54807.1 hypothetical protein KIMH_09180 [Bombiscardovia apis]
MDSSTLTLAPVRHTIKEASLISGLPESTLRYYEDIGIIGPIERDISSGHRAYNDEDVDLLLAISCLNATGMPLNNMREYLENRAKGAQGAEREVELLAVQAERLDRELEELQLRRKYVDVKTHYWQAIGREDYQEAQDVLDRGESVIEALRAFARQRKSSRLQA